MAEGHRTTIRYAEIGEGREIAAGRGAQALGDPSTTTTTTSPPVLAATGTDKGDGIKTETVAADGATAGIETEAADEAAPETTTKTPALCAAKAHCPHSKTRSP